MVEHGAVQATRRGRPGIVPWAARTLVAIALVAVALWWSSSKDFAGLGYCEANAIPEGECDAWAPNLTWVVLWPVTACASALVCLAASFIGPASIRQRIVWGAMIGCAVFIANRNNLVWASLATPLAVWCVVCAAADPSDSLRPTRVD